MSLLSKRSKGQDGEARAEEYLVMKGYDILEKNYRNRLGEIDIIARDGKTLVFIEVKTRNCGSHGLPVDAVNSRKRRRIGRVAVYYMAEKNMDNSPCRFDVLSIYQEKIELFVDAFDLQEGPAW